MKAAGVVVDDTAVTPQYLHGSPAARELPIGTAYAVWTGIGAAGTVTRSLNGGTPGPTVFTDARADNNFTRCANSPAAGNADNVLMYASRKPMSRTASQPAANSRM